MNFDAWRHYLRGRLFSLLRNPAQAAAAYRHTLAVDRNCGAAARRLGYLLAEQGQGTEAEQWLQESLRIAPNDAITWFNLGYLRDNAGHKEQAIEAFGRATALNPKLDVAWYGMGMALAALGRHAEAIVPLERAAALQPNNGQLWYVLAMAHHTLGERDKVTGVAEHLHRIDPRRTNQLISETGRSDLADLYTDMMG